MRRAPDRIRTCGLPLRSRSTRWPRPFPAGVVADPRPRSPAGKGRKAVVPRLGGCTVGAWLHQPVRWRSQTPGPGRRLPPRAVSCRTCRRSPHPRRRRPRSTRPDRPIRCPTAGSPGSTTAGSLSAPPQESASCRARRRVGTAWVPRSEPILRRSSLERGYRVRYPCEPVEKLRPSRCRRPGLGTSGSPRTARSAARNAGVRMVADRRAVSWSRKQRGSETRLIAR